MAAALHVVAGLLILAGMAGTVLPALPGAPLVFAGMLLAAAVDGFRLVSVPVVLLLAALALLSLLAEHGGTLLGVRRAGASRWAVVGAGVGALAGLPFGLAGLLLGPLAGAVAGELLARRDLRQAGRAGLAAWGGFLAGTLAKLALVAVMLAVFATALLVD